MKTSLAKAVALAATLGAAASAHAVNVNSDGLGQVLLYPLFTTENGNNTLINVVNTTDKYKAVKVRFLEGKNSQEVLDFNLYLSPHDVWSAGVTFKDGKAGIQTPDKSCTLPLGVSRGDFVPFVDYALNDAAGRKLERARVGHVEVIEMGEVDPALDLTAAWNASDVLSGAGAYDPATYDARQTAALTNPSTAAFAIKHVNGTPGNCGNLATAMLSKVWNRAGSTAALRNGINPAAGGLVGSATVVNPADGVQFNVDPVAIDNFYEAGLAAHTETGNTAPDLRTGANAIATFKNGDQLEFIESLDAVSAVLAKESLIGEYVIGGSLNGETEYVITFPTKRHYVQPVPAVAPFSESFIDRNGFVSAPEPVAISYWDREEKFPTEPAGDLVYSPAPPTVVSQDPVLHFETNILSLGTEGGEFSQVLGGAISEVRAIYPLAPGYNTGWVNFDFENTLTLLPNRQLQGYVVGTTTAGDVIQGLPVVGVGVYTVARTNGDGLSKYSTSSVLKAKTTLDIQ